MTPEAVRDEVERLHLLIERWFQGTAAEADFGVLERALHPGFENIQPAGRVLTKSDLTTGLKAAYGANPAFRIEIRDVRLIAAYPEAGLVLATYLEMQFAAKNTVPPDNLRRSTVLFETGADRLIWRHLHETAVPL